MKFKIIVKDKQLQNFPIPVADIDRSGAINGPRVAILKGKSVHKHPSYVDNITRVPLSLQIEKEYNNISLLM